MRTILHARDRTEIIARILNLQADDQGLWGKMNVYQMLKHCTQSDEMFLGHCQYKRVFLGRIIGRMVLRSIIKDEAPMKSNEPTLTELRINGSGDFEAERSKWTGLIKAYETYGCSGFIHPFFGKMDRQQVGILVYKHADHHLRQFGR